MLGRGKKAKDFLASIHTGQAKAVFKLGRKATEGKSRKCKGQPTLAQSFKGERERERDGLWLPATLSRYARGGLNNS